MQPMIEGQLNEEERKILRDAILTAVPRPKILLEVGTWLGGGSTVHILKALQENGEGHLWGIEADSSIYKRMIENIQLAAPNEKHRFTPLFGLSQNVIPQWIRGQPQPLEVDFVFLDGGNNPMEQIIEFQLLAPLMPVGAQLFSHDAKLRKGKWLVPYVRMLDNWQVDLCDVSAEGLLRCRKIAAQPSQRSIQDAERTLTKLRLEPAEIAAALLPSSVCGFVLKLLPERIARALSDGRR